MFEMLGRSSEDQQRQPLVLRVADYVIEPLTDRFRAPKIMMLIKQSVAPLQFVRLEQSHLQAVQDDLILGAGHPKFFAHAPKLEKSEGACPAKRVYAFPLNYLHGVMDWRCKQRQQLGKQPFHPEVLVGQLGL